MLLQNYIISTLLVSTIYKESIQKYKPNNIFIIVDIWISLI